MAYLRLLPSAPRRKVWHTEVFHLQRRWRNCVPENSCFSPYQKTGILDTLPKVLKVDYSYIWLAVNAKTKISEIYKQKFPSCSRVRGKERLSLTLRHTTAWVLQGHKIYLLLLQLRISTLLHLNTDSEFTKIAPATSPRRAYNLNMK